MSAPDKVTDTLEAYGVTCGTLEPMMATRLRALAPGEVLEVRSDMPEAKDGIASWLWLTGHTLLAVEEDQPPRVRYYVRKNNEKGV